MAEGFLKQYAPTAEVFSAGTYPAGIVHPLAVRVMSEKGIDLSKNSPKSVDRFLTQAFEYVITVCDDANESCPAFLGVVKNRIHIGFEDPARAKGSEEFVIGEFRRIRDEIDVAFKNFAQRISS